MNIQTRFSGVYLNNARNRKDIVHNIDFRNIDIAGFTIDNKTYLTTGEDTLTLRREEQRHTEQGYKVSQREVLLPYGYSTLALRTEEGEQYSDSLEKLNTVKRELAGKANNNKRVRFSED